MEQFLDWGMIVSIIGSVASMVNMVTRHWSAGSGTPIARIASVLLWIVERLSFVSSGGKAKFPLTDGGDDGIGKTPTGTAFLILAIGATASNCGSSLVSQVRSVHYASEVALDVIDGMCKSAGGSSLNQCLSDRVRALQGLKAVNAALTRATMLGASGNDSAKIGIDKASRDLSVIVSGVLKWVIK